jgi:integrase
MKLTSTAVRALTLSTGKSEAIFFDDDVPGFGLRLREHGSRTFVFQYKLGAKQRRMALGTATALTISNARKTAERLYARVKLGEDPASDKEDAKRGAAESFKAIADLYLDDKRTKLSPNYFSTIERHLRTCAKPLHSVPLGKIALRDIASVLTAVPRQMTSPRAGDGARSANSVRASLSGFFAWAMGKGLADRNPVVGTERSAARTRERVLEPAELRSIWKASGNDHFGSIIKLLALTGQREGEISGLRWSELPHPDTMVLPAERTKNRHPHVVPLAPLAADLIAKQPRRTKPSGEPNDHIFGQTGERGFTGWSRAKRRLDTDIAQMVGKPLPHWTIHDLRRSFSTYAGGGVPAHQLEQLSGHDKKLASGLGIQPHIVEAILNHKPGGVAKIYDRSSYEAEKRTALDRWADHLMAIVEERQSNVTSFKRA